MLGIMSLSSNLSPLHSIFGLTEQVSLVSSPECQDWWAAGCRQNTSTLPANCTVCSAVKSLQIVTDFRELSEKLQKHQPFLIKVMQGFLRLADESNSWTAWAQNPAQYFHPWTQTARSGHVSKKTFRPSVKMWEERVPCIVPLTNDHCIWTFSNLRGCCSWMFSSGRAMGAGSNSGGTVFIFVSCSLRQGSISPTKNWSIFSPRIQNWQRLS